MPVFDGKPESFKEWKRGVYRFCAVNNVEATLEVGYVDGPNFNLEDNKLLYFSLEQAVSKKAKPLQYFLRAALGDGNGAYLAIHDGYTFKGCSMAPILLQQLTNVRMLASELPSDFCLRLMTLFEDLEALPGDDAFSFNDTQKLGHLLKAIKQESDLAMSYNHIQTLMTRNAITFDEACDDLNVRCETIRADALLKDPPARRAMITTENKRMNVVEPYALCLTAGCVTRSRFPFCRLHHAEMVCGRTKEMKLRGSYGTATYDSATDTVKYPSTVPSAMTKPEVFRKAN
jgi:hypothetical protein